VTTHKQAVQFTPKQLAELEKVFPQMTHGYSTPVDQIREYFGQQSVLDFVRKRVQGDSFHSQV
jgi:hypothetical protein